MHVFAAHLGKSQREGEADDEAFAAGEVFGAAGFAALVVVDDVEFERACRVGGEQVAVAQLYQLAVCLGDDAGKCQALCVVAVFFAVRRADEFVQVLPAPGFGGLFCDGLLLGGKALAGAFVFGEAVLVCGEGLLVLLSGVFVGFLARLQGGGVGVVGALCGEAGKAGGAVLLAGVQGEGLLVQGGGLAGERFACGGGQACGLPGGFVGECFGEVCCRCAVFYTPSPGSHVKGFRLFHGYPRALPRFAGEGVSFSLVGAERVVYRDAFEGGGELLFCGL